MPRFFFHTESETRTTDEEGMELADGLEARRQAIKSCGEMVRDCPQAFWGSRPWSVTVTNAEGLILWEIFMDGVSSPCAPA